jgi:polysaccharide pyruvyl transferase WcaK-like protein
LFGLFGVGNVGNEASLASGIQALRAAVPHAEVVVVGAFPGVVTEQHGVPAVSIITGGRLPILWRLPLPRPLRWLARPLAEPMRWLTVRRFLSSIDAVVVPGTGILDDFGVGPRQMPYDLFRWTALARSARTPWAMVAVGAGPIEHRASRGLIRRAVRRSQVVTYRDEGSRQFMRGLGEPLGSDSVQPDVVFSHPVPVDRRPGQVPGHVGLGLMRYGGWNATQDFDEAVFDAYVEAMAEIAVRLLDLGCSIRVLIGEDADVEAVSRVVEAVRRHRGDAAAESLTVEPIHTFDDLLEQIAHTDAVVATRFHNVVAALMMGRPTVSIGYADKNRELMTAFGVGEYCHRVDRLDVDRVVVDVVTVLGQREPISSSLARTSDSARHEVERRFRDAFQALGLTVTEPATIGIAATRAWSAGEEGSNTRRTSGQEETS